MTNGLEVDLQRKADESVRTACPEVAMKITACLGVVAAIVAVGSASASPKWSPGPGALESRSRNVREMMMANAVAHQADAVTQRLCGPCSRATWRDRNGDPR